MEQNLIIAISAGLISIVVAIISLIGVIYSANKKISRSNNKEHHELKEKVISNQNELDKEGHTLNKVLDTLTEVSSANLTIKKLYERQKTKDEIIGTNFVNSMQSALNAHKELIEENKNLTKQNLEFSERIVNLELENQVLLENNQKLTKSLSKENIRATSQ